MAPASKPMSTPKKQVNVQIPEASKRYAEELMEEENADREAHGKKSFDDGGVYPQPTNGLRP